MSDWRTDPFKRRELTGDVKQISDHWPAVEQLLDDPQALNGIALWPGQEGFWGVRLHESTVIAGMNYAGKSTLMTQILLRLLCAVKDSRAMVYSPEMPAPSLAMQIVRQAGAKGLGNEARTRKILKWLNLRLMHLDTPGYTSEELFQAIEYHSFERGVKWLAIDSLMCITDIRGDDYVAQKAFMQHLMRLVRELPVHLFLIAHVRKPDKFSNRGEFDRYDIRGAGEIPDFADNILLIKRYKDPNGEHRQLLVRDKERFSPGRAVDELDLGFDQASQQFTAPYASAQAYIPDLEVIDGYS